MSFDSPSGLLCAKLLSHFILFEYSVPGTLVDKVIKIKLSPMKCLFRRVIPSYYLEEHQDCVTESLRFLILQESFIKLYCSPKETSWDTLSPVTYKAYHCISYMNRFPLKLYVFLKNVVLHNVMCEKNWIVITTQFYWLSHGFVNETHIKNAARMEGSLLVYANKFELWRTAWLEHASD